MHGSFCMSILPPFRSCRCRCATTACFCSSSCGAILTYLITPSPAWQPCMATPGCRRRLRLGLGCKIFFMATQFPPASFSKRNSRDQAIALGTSGRLKSVGRAWLRLGLCSLGDPQPEAPASSVLAGICVLGSAFLGKGGLLAASSCRAQLASAGRAGTATGAC